MSHNWKLRKAYVHTATASTFGIRKDLGANSDEWTKELRRQLLQRFLEIRLGEPVRNYWAVIAKDFPGFTKEQVKDKACNKFFQIMFI